MISIINTLSCSFLERDVDGLLVLLEYGNQKELSIDDNQKSLERFGRKRLLIE